MKKQILYILFFIVCFSIFSEESGLEKGTLIVSYHLGTKQERLNKVRFWLRNEKYEQRMYPVEEGFFDDVDEEMRTVVIDHLPTGSYVIEFVVPNYDDVFDEIALQEVVIKEGQITKFIQKIQPKS